VCVRKPLSCFTTTSVHEIRRWEEPTGTWGLCGFACCAAIARSVAVEAVLHARVRATGREHVEKQQQA